MTKDEVRSRAIRAGEVALKQLRDTGSIIPCIELFNSTEQGDTLLAVEGSVMNDKGAKVRLAELVRRKIAKGNYRSALMVSDTWDLGPMDEATAAKVSELQAQGIYSLPEIAARGVGELHEQIRVLAQGSYTLMAQWRYYRDKDGNVERIDSVVVDDSMEPVVGGIFKFY